MGPKDIDEEEEADVPGVVGEALVDADDEVADDDVGDDLDIDPADVM